MESTELKEGDRVVCVNDRPREGSLKHIPLQAGKDYTVFAVEIFNGKPHIAIKEALYSSTFNGVTCKAAEEKENGYDPIHWFNPSRFKKI